VTAAILDHHRVAALALDQRGDIGLTEVAPEDQQITLPVAELRSIGNEIRALADPAVQRDRAVAGLRERRGRRAGDFTEMVQPVGLVSVSGVPRHRPPKVREPRPADG